VAPPGTTTSASPAAPTCRSWPRSAPATRLRAGRYFVRGRAGELDAWTSFFREAHDGARAVCAATSSSASDS